MAKSQEIVITGKIRFAALTRLSQYGKWTVVIYPDQASMEKVHQLIKDGIKNELKKDDDGYYIAFSRPPEKTDRAGRKFLLAAPVLIDKDGRVLDQPVGQGSDVAVKLEVYGGKAPTGGTYKAARLGGVKVYNLVPYDPEQSMDKREAKSATVLNAQPEPVDTW